MSLVALIDYGSGNLRSAEKALARATEERGTGHTIVVTADPSVAAKADRIVLPGVGAFADCMGGLKALPGMVEALSEAVLGRGTPFLGICVGMQLMATRGLEFEVTDGLDWIAGEVRAIEPGDPNLKIPHMGWNQVNNIADMKLLQGLREGFYAYFVHSFYPAPAERLAATRTDYGVGFASAVARGNLFACQFHPEKSSGVGLRILKNYARLLGQKRRDA